MEGDVVEDRSIEFKLIKHLEDTSKSECSQE